MQNRTRWISAAILTGTAFQATATGFRLPDQDAFATARGEAFAATADNPSAIYYNPAGITQLEGSNFRGGVYGLYLSPSYRNPATGEKFSNDKDLHAVPSLFYTYTPEKFPLSFGIGAYAPYGLSSRWPQDSGFRTVATEGSLTYYTVNPVVAWKVTEAFSIAAGIRFNYSKVDLRQGLVWPAQSFDEFRFKGDGWDVGYNLGALWKVHEKVVLGATFRSTTTVDYEGHTDVRNEVAFPPGNPMVPPFSYRSDARGELPFPLSVVAGISFRPTPKWNFEFNADYNGWDRLNTLTIEQETAPIPLIPASVPVVLNWESSWYYEFGATHYFDNGWTVSAGYVFNENSLSSASYTPLVADQDRHFFSVGTGYKGQRFNFDVAYQFGYGPSRTISDGTPSVVGQTANGYYKFLSHAVSLSGGWRF
jgi:long-chain fatty acid transport protein